MKEWLGPILGAGLLLAAAVGVAYKVLSGYQHPSPDAFISVRDQNRLPAASAVDHPTQSAAVPVDAAAPAQGAASAALGAVSAAQTAPASAAPPAASGDLAVALPAASKVLFAEAQDNPACVPIKAEQREIEGGLKKQYSPEQGRFMQRRLRELAEQSVSFNCAE